LQPIPLNPELEPTARSLNPSPYTLSPKPQTNNLEPLNPETRRIRERFIFLCSKIFSLFYHESLEVFQLKFL
jgi:hypothetical protein